MILSHRACNHRQVFLLHHQRFDWKFIEIVHQQIADLSIVRQIHFFLYRLIWLSLNGSGWRYDPVFRAQVTNEMIFSTELRWAHFTVKPRRNSNALVSHVSLQMSSTQVALSASRTWKSFRLVRVHFREDFRDTSKVLFFNARGLIFMIVLWVMIISFVCDMCVCGWYVKVMTKRYMKEKKINIKKWKWIGLDMLKWIAKLRKHNKRKKTFYFVSQALQNESSIASFNLPQKKKLKIVKMSNLNVHQQQQILVVMDLYESLNNK